MRGYPYEFLGYRCAGVWVCWCLGVFLCSYSFASACLPTLGACRPWVPACQETPKSTHASGTSGPLTAPRGDGAIFLTAAKTNKRSVRRGFLLTLGWFLLRTQDMILFQNRVRRDEQTERVCAAYASLIPIRRATNTIRPGEYVYIRTDVATCLYLRVHTRTCRHVNARQDARRRPRPVHIGIFERLAFSTFQIFKLSDISHKGATQKNTQKTESEHRAQQQRGSNARYHQLRSARF